MNRCPPPACATATLTCHQSNCSTQLSLLHCTAKGKHWNQKALYIFMCYSLLALSVAWQWYTVVVHVFELQKKILKRYRWDVCLFNTWLLAVILLPCHRPYNPPNELHLQLCKQLTDVCCCLATPPNMGGAMLFFWLLFFSFKSV